MNSQALEGWGMKRRKIVTVCGPGPRDEDVWEIHKTRRETMRIDGPGGEVTLPYSVLPYVIEVAATLLAEECVESERVCGECEAIIAEGTGDGGICARCLAAKHNTVHEPEEIHEDSYQ